MQMYSLQKNRNGLLVLPDGTLRTHTLTEDKAFTSDDIAMDPIRFYNDKRQGFYKSPTTEFDKTAERLAVQGYTVFVQRGTRSDKQYGFAVIITETDTEMD